MSLKSFARLLVTSALFVTTAAFASHAQNRLSRGANQPIDEEYSKKIREYTTEPFFNSPLTDYLPASPSG